MREKRLRNLETADGGACAGGGVSPVSTMRSGASAYDDTFVEVSSATDGDGDFVSEIGVTGDMFSFDDGRAEFGTS